MPSNFLLEASGHSARGCSLGLQCAHDCSHHCSVLMAVHSTAVCSWLFTALQYAHHDCSHHCPVLMTVHSTAVCSSWLFTSLQCAHGCSHHCPVLMAVHTTAVCSWLFIQAEVCSEDTAFPMSSLHSVLCLLSGQCCPWLDTVGAEVESWGL